MQCADCTRIDTFDLRGFAGQAPGKGKVEVTFSIDLDGKLTVSAKNMLTGDDGHLEVDMANAITP